MEQPTELIFGSSLFENAPRKAAAPPDPPKLDMGISPFADPVDVTTATLENGRQIVLRSRDLRKRSTIETDKHSKDTHFGVPIHSLLASARAANSNAAQNGKDQHQRNTENRAEAVVSSNVLLSEKYRPRVWTDLAGSEKLHRVMMRWLVSWSHVVFGAEIKDQGAFSRNDALGRPRKKILLIHGPPGIGKTTVAHVLAKQAGYEALEINASDERNAAIESSSDNGSKRVNVIKNRIATALYSQRVGGKGKPVCVIADEIDGASENGLIRALIDLVKADERALHRFQNEDGSKRATVKKKGKHDTTLLQRPIIAVCNDAYAPALKDLRHYAEMVHYTKVPSRSVVTRLKDICTQENIVADTATLTEVANTMDGDLRSCLNMLQYGMSRNDQGKLVSKDTIMNLRSTANRVFCRKDDKAKEMGHIMELAHAYGDYEKLIMACFQLYPQKQFYDDLMKKPAEIGEWTAFYEILHSAMWRNQNFQLAGYFAHPVAVFYDLFNSSMSITEDNIPSIDFEMFETRRKTQTLAKEFLASISAPIRHMLNFDTFLLEAGPYILQIANPKMDFLSTAASTAKPHHKRKVADAAQAMIGLNMKFKKDKLDGGTVVWRLEPPYEQVVLFDDQEKQKASVGSKFTTRQAIADVIQSKWLQSKEINSDAMGSKKRPLEESTNRPNKKQKAAGDMKLKSRKKTDFFGRVIEEPISAEHSNDGTPVPEAGFKDQQEDTKIWVQYVEGFSNAVRKDITWKELWA